MLSVSPSSLSFTAGQAATQNLTLSSTDSFNSVSLASVYFAPGFTAQHPYDDEVSKPFTVVSPLGDGVGFGATLIIPGATLTIPVAYSGTGTASAGLTIVYNGVGRIGTVIVPVAAA